MSVRMTKLLLALGLMTAAGSSGAFYITGGAGHNLTQDGYCASLYDGSTRLYTGIMRTTLGACQQQLNAEVQANGNLAIVAPCGLCQQKFGQVPETAFALPTRHVLEYLERFNALREEFRIDDYERAQQELSRSMSLEAKP